MVLTAALATTSVAAQDGGLRVPMHAQEAGNWCWAATTQMLLSYWAVSTPNLQVSNQCQMATARTRQTVTPDIDCRCTYCKPSDLVLRKECDSGGAEPPLEAYFEFQTTPLKALSFEQLECQLERKRRPVIFEWRWGRGGSHVMVAVGTRRAADGTGYVMIQDPQPVCHGRTCIIDHARYDKSETEEETFWLHGTDYYDIVPKVGEVADISCSPANPPAAIGGLSFAASAEDLEKFARNEAARLLSALTAQDRERLGLPVAPPPAQIDVGVALKQWLLPLKPGGPPLSSSFPQLKNTETTLLYAITVGAQPSGVLTLFRDGPSWKGARLCDDDQAEQVFADRRALATREGISQAEIGSVYLPLLNLQFLTFRRNGQKWIVPQGQDPVSAPVIDPWVLPPSQRIDQPWWDGILDRAGRHNGLPG